MNNNITITLIKSNEPDNDPRLIKEIIILTFAQDYIKERGC